MAIYLHCGKIAHPSEIEFFNAMRQNLPSDWIVLGNIQLHDKSRDKETDAIIISPGVMWMVELKAWPGRIIADAEIWKHGNKKSKSPVNQICMAAKIYGPRLGQILDLFAKPCLVMMRGEARDLNGRFPGREKVIWFKDAVHQFKSGAKGSKMPEISKIKQVISRYAGNDRLRAYLAGGDPIPDKPDAPATNLVFTLLQNDFQHCYYSEELSKIFLGKEELRGAQPPNWHNWNNHGAWLEFSEDGIYLEAIPGTKLVLDNTEITPGTTQMINVPSGELSIGGITFTFTIKNTSSS